MFDIFSERPQPKIYVADVGISFEYRPRKNSKQFELHKIKLEKVPVVLYDGKFPTDKTRKNFMRRAFENHGKGKFENSNMKILGIKNIKYLSDLAYKFDYDKH